jgi:ABC-type Fe3+ transport system substrate-binding protein
MDRAKKDFSRCARNDTLNNLSSRNEVRDLEPTESLPTGVLSKARRPDAARLFSSFLVSREDQQKIAGLNNVVVRKNVEPKNAVDRLRAPSAFGRLLMDLAKERRRFR